MNNEQKEMLDKIQKLTNAFIQLDRDMRPDNWTKVTDFLTDKIDAAQLTEQTVPFTTINLRSNVSTKPEHYSTASTVPYHNNQMRRNVFTPPPKNPGVNADAGFDHVAATPAYAPSSSPSSSLVANPNKDMGYDSAAATPASAPSSNPPSASSSAVNQNPDMGYDSPAATPPSASSSAVNQNPDMGYDHVQQEQGRPAPLVSSQSHGQLKEKEKEKEKEIDPLVAPKRKNVHGNKGPK